MYSLIQSLSFGHCDDGTVMTVNLSFAEHNAHTRNSDGEDPGSFDIFMA